MFQIIIIVTVLSDYVYGQSDAMIKFLFVHDSGQEDILQYFQTTLASTYKDKYDVFVVSLEEDESEDFGKVCNGFLEGATIVIDISWSGYDRIKHIASGIGVPYIKIDATISPILHLLDMFMDARNTTDIAYIFDDPKDVDEALYYWIEFTRLRMVLTDHLDKVSADRLRTMRPMPHSYAIVSTTDKMDALYQKCAEEDLIQRPERWNLVFLDFERDNFDATALNESVNLIYLTGEMCCTLNGVNDCICTEDHSISKLFVSAILYEISETLNKIATATGGQFSEKVTCNSTPFDEAAKNMFEKEFHAELRAGSLVRDDLNVLRLRVKGKVDVATGKGSTQPLAKYSDDYGMEIEPDQVIKPVKPFLRIGTTPAIPWSYQEVDPQTGNKYWTGFCIEFAQKLSELMNFDYEIVEPEHGTFGNKINGKWDGVIGDLARGETDIALTSLIMTADKEEVIDFVAPYFDQTGISIVMRKPMRRTSLFKFMTVLKLEVWMSIVGALVVTGFMVWILDKYSPYSARNNKKAYPYPCRDFTLKESFWFALTSFTPQGGGEAPKALSGRTLVAAYWLFVVLMLATFTANLAAFLTVERMQTPVQSLEQLARQSRIKYTVVESSIVHNYFINMKYAEDMLYTMWKELTLNSSTDETKYRVWDYPIREQWGHILIAINDSNPVENAQAGFNKVDENVNSDFAFIHDAMEIKYEMSRSCNLTEVGEVFGEMPYAVAVQQGSQLMDQISVKILDLQRDRFFETLQGKYWNASLRGDCGSEDSEGISLESLGGVFIATLFGLALAMLTLGGEVIYHRRQRRVQELKPGGGIKIQPLKHDRFNEIQQQMQQYQKKQHQKEFKVVNKVEYPGNITIGDTFKPITDKDRRRMSHYSLYPKPRNRLPNVD